MNEIEKLYENVGVNKKCIDKRYEKCTGVCYDCKCFIYPPFTAEKQLSLIKWIAEHKEECRITYEKEYKWCTQTDWQSSFCYESFEESLVNLINTIWQDLTEEEQQQIRDILKG